MAQLHWHHRRPPPRGPRPPSAQPPAQPPAAEVRPVGLDLLRADLYRLLDELVRAPAGHRPRLVQEFERSWEEFKEATARRADQED
ncbi:hypothetical protein [Anaeromyxobacter diazotrophicus]|uniref:Uncharacterized protein n=1 Tax=Anaeromyxobacter diazotrophicus TaxID=2590199 RepID=A0A7I9VR37_9BACT|nr:hypothetical protein [Anaeromyxobacter diazotrophicus]GEJ58884.1 hypothetical protein AMYX_36250 [Anaeromyxobacter diazotrophicus]